MNYDIIQFCSRKSEQIERIKRTENWENGSRAGVNIFTLV